MTTEYKLIPFKFDADKFGEAIKTASGGDLSLIASMVGVDITTVRNWAKNAYKTEFNTPHMSNFMRACNWLDLDPRVFFVLDTPTDVILICPACGLRLAGVYSASSHEFAQCEACKKRWYRSLGTSGNTTWEEDDIPF